MAHFDLSGMVSVGPSVGPVPATRELSTQSESAATSESTATGEFTATSDSTVERIERRLNEVDELFAKLDAGEFDLEPADFAWPAGLRLSVVIPVYNERATILEVVARVLALPVPKEVIVVDDCSTDGTRGWLETMRGTPHLRLILKPQNEGKGAALRTGFDAAEGDIVIVQDADLEYQPRDILDVVKPIAMGETDVVFGSRYLDDKHRDASIVHRLGNRILTACSNWMNGTRLTDMETCYKAFRRSVLRSIDLKQNRFGFEPEVTAKLARRGYDICEVPIHYQPRSYADGKKIGIRDLLNTLWCILRYGWSD
ncbi:MAG: glycosyltransferase family 2 protein [Pirellulaceae bacterium]